MIIAINANAEFVCRQCTHVFTFNNQFYINIRQFCKHLITNNSTKFLSKSTELYLNKNDDIKKSLINFKVDLNKNIDTEYSF